MVKFGKGKKPVTLKQVAKMNVREVRKLLSMGMAPESPGPRVGDTGGGKAGDCYEVHANYLVKAANDPDAPRNLTLCHGQVWSLQLEKWISHAWLEYEQEVPAPPDYPGGPPRIKTVMDISQGQHTVSPAFLWYRTARARKVRRYTLEQAARLMLHTHHYGPWQ